MQYYRYCSVLSIAGSDSGGGAGIQADLKTFAALGCFGTTAITAITAQNTQGITGLYPLPAHIVKSQITAVIDDICPDAIKIGMLPNGEIVCAVAEILKQYNNIPIILDPVMRATSGKELATATSVDAMKQHLFPIITLITPNIGEASLLTGTIINTLDDMKTAADNLLLAGCNAVLVKGGHLHGPELFNVYAHQNGERKTWSYQYIESLNTHGTGCTLSSAITAYLASGLSPEASIAAAGEYVNTAIKEGQNVKTGHGNGPLNHFFNPNKPLMINHL